MTRTSAAEAAAATRLLAAIRSIDDEGATELHPGFAGRLLIAMERTAPERLGTQFETEWEAGSSECSVRNGSAP
jgi:hypothetical protein